MPQDKQIIVKGDDKTNNIHELKMNNDKINITYKDGRTYSYKKEDVQVKRSALANEMASKCFKYLKQIAEAVGLQNENGKNILANHYDKIDFVSEESMLSVFLTGKMNTVEHPNTNIAVYPFGFNMSQKIAIDNALKNQLSIIEGPPGTGKTQTILNIIANVVMRGESIAVVSNNNSATANVLEKFKKEKVDFIAAYLGNNDNKTKFIEEQKPLVDSI